VDVAKVDPPTQRLISRCCSYLFSNVTTTFNIFFMVQTLIIDVTDVEF
jgi:hypothetical protein